MQFMMECADLKLYPSINLGYVYGVPYKGKLSPILGYKGMIQLALRSSKIAAIQCYEICAGDIYEETIGTNQHLKFVPQDTDRSEANCTGAVAIVTLANGFVVWHKCTKEEIHESRARSPSWRNGNKTFWGENWKSMYKKCPMREIFKYLPHEDQIMTEKVISIESNDYIDAEAEEQIDFDQEKADMVERLEAEGEAK